MTGQIYSLIRKNGRAENQDYLFYEKKKFNDNEEMTVFGICDGMGGMEQGGQLSRLTAWTFGAYFTQKIVPFLAKENAVIPKRKEIREILENTMESVQRTIAAYIKKHRISGGSTLTAGVICKNSLHVVNAGDSPCYLIDMKNDAVILVSNVENYAYEGLAKGIFTNKKSPEFERASSYLTNYIGAKDFRKPEAHSYQIFPGNRVLAGSDGLFGNLDEEEILTAAKDLPEEKSLERIAGKSVSMGETDNQSGVLWVWKNR